MPPIVGRRGFIQLGALSVGLAPALGSTRRRTLLPSERQEARGTTADPEVGYWLGSEDRTDLAYVSPEETHASDTSVFAADVVSAEKLSPDPELDAGAAVTVHGLIEGRSSWQGPALESVSLTARYALPEATEAGEVEFQAWSLVRTRVTSRRAPVQFLVPTGPGVELTFTLERRNRRRSLRRRMLDAALVGNESGSGDSVARSFETQVRLCSGRAGRSPRLRCGVYLLAASDRPRWSRIAWEEYRFRPTHPAAGRLERIGAGGVEVAAFDCLVISIERPVLST